jgi:ferric enterobactin receptor
MYHKIITILCFTAFLLLASETTKAQQKVDLSIYSIDKLLAGNLDEVIDEIAKTTKLEFNFDRQALSKIYVVDRFEGLDVSLKRVLGKENLKYYIDTKGVIQIIGKYAKSKDVALSDTKTYTGEPTRKNIAVAGIIRDELSGEALPFATIIVKGTSIGTTTNVDGYFSILNVPNDTVCLVASYVGYNTLRFYLNPSMKLDNVEIDLSTSNGALDEVTVTAEREELLRTNGEIISMIKMSPSKLTSLPSVGERDIMRSFQLMPGISAANENSSGLYVRGGTPDQNLNVYDGITVYHVDHLFGFFSAFNPNAIKDVQLYKGGFPAKFGGRLSSVSELTGKDGNQISTAGGVDLGLLSVNAYIEQPIGDKVSTLFAVRRSWKSPLYDQIFDRFSGENEQIGGGGAFSQFQSTVRSYFYDLNGKITFRPTKKDILTLSLYNGTDDMDNSTNISLPFGGGGGGLGISDVTKWGNLGGSFKWSRRWSDKLYSNALVGYSKYFSDRDRTAGGTFTDDNTGEERTIRNGTLENNDLKDLTSKIDFEYKINDRNTLEFGLQNTFNDIAYTYAQNDTSTVLDRQSKGNTSSIYLQDKVSLFNDRLTLTGGLRGTYFEPSAKMYAEPRYSAAFKLSNKIRLKAAGGIFYQYANRIVREDILRGSRDFWILSDGESVPVSKATHYIGGISYETKDYLFDVEAYYKKLDGLTEYSLRFGGNPAEGFSYNENFYNGTGYSQGLEIMAQKKYGNYNGWVSYTLAQTRYNFPIYGETDFAAAQDVTNEFKIVNSYKWRRFEFAATYVYATGRPYTAPEGAYQLTLLDGEKQDYINVGAKNGQRLPDYHRLDFAATYKFLPRANGRDKGSISVSIFNAYNRQNVWYKEYEIIENRLIENNVKFLGFTPNIAYSLKF